jgi:hypothetical protein
MTVPRRGGSYERLLEVLLHELVHVAVWGSTAHDMVFKRKQMEAMFMAFPQISGRLGPWDLSEGAYVLDRKVQAAMRTACVEQHTNAGVLSAA